jgi:hypothetical protein
MIIGDRPFRQISRIEIEGLSRKDLSHHWDAPPGPGEGDSADGNASGRLSATA